MVMMGVLPPYPGDLALFFSRMEVSYFSALRSCRTMERLDRRIGQRRDATRAPNQARNGRRPSGRLLLTLPHHLSDAQILSNLWGPPHTTASLRACRLSIGIIRAAAAASTYIATGACRFAYLTPSPPIVPAQCFSESDYGDAPLDQCDNFLIPLFSRR